MALSYVPDCWLVSRSVKLSAPCKDCEDRGVGCHGKCEKYRAYKERMSEERRKCLKAYGDEQIHENYCRKVHEKIVKRQRTGRR